MQIRYLEAMQAMAKSSNSKVIFMPGSSQTFQQSLAKAVDHGEGSSSDAYQPSSEFQSAINTTMMEHI